MHSKNFKWATLEEMIDHQQKSPAKIAYKKVQANRTVGLKLTATQVKTIKKTLSSKNSSSPSRSWPKNTKSAK